MENSFINHEQSLYLFAKLRNNYYSERWKILNKKIHIYEMCVFYPFLVIFLTMLFICDLSICIKYFIIYFVFFQITTIFLRVIMELHINSEKYKYNIYLR